MCRLFVDEITSKRVGSENYCFNYIGRGKLRIICIRNTVGGIDLVRYLKSSVNVTINN